MGNDRKTVIRNNNIATLLFWCLVLSFLLYLFLPVKGSFWVMMGALLFQILHAYLLKIIQSLPENIGKRLRNEFTQGFHAMFFSLISLIVITVIMSRAWELNQEFTSPNVEKLFTGVFIFFNLIFIYIIRYKLLLNTRKNVPKVLISGLSMLDKKKFSNGGLDPRIFPLLSVLQKYKSIEKLILILSEENRKFLSEMETEKIGFIGDCCNIMDVPIPDSVDHLDVHDQYFSCKEMYKLINHFVDQLSGYRDDQILFNLTSAPIPVSVSFAFTSLPGNRACIYTSQKNRPNTSKPLKDQFLDACNALQEPFIFDHWEFNMNKAFGDEE